jgi:multiple antibiotic resistance protein
MNPADLVRDFITIFVVVDPIGTVPVFVAATAGAPADRHRRIAVRAVAIAAGVLLFFVLFGQIVLEGIGISLASFQIAGGIILFLFALTMIFGETKPESEIAQIRDDPMQCAVFPLAIPSIASPGAMLAVVALTDNDRFSIAEQAVTVGLLGLVLLIALALMLAAAPLNRLIGAGGASVISRVMGMILASVAVDTVLRGLSEIGLPIVLIAA